mgnify:CR=1 FL=1
MSKKAILVSATIVIFGVAAAVLMFTGGRGKGVGLVYVPDEAVRHREKGEFLLNRRLHTTDRTQKAELLTEAIEEFKKALAVKPDFETVHNLLGHAYMERGQWETALTHLNRALELRADYPAALYNRGRLYAQVSLGKRDKELLRKAIADYQAALSSELSVGFTGDILKALADAQNQADDLAGAIETLKRYLRVAPHAPDAALIERKIRGLMLMQKGTAPPEGEIYKEAVQAPKQDS